VVENTDADGHGRDLREELEGRGIGGRHTHPEDERSEDDGDVSGDDDESRVAKQSADGGHERPLGRQSEKSDSEPSDDRV
jgi:hypothetical protein